MTPGHKKCARFDVLFKQYTDETQVCLDNLEGEEKPESFIKVCELIDLPSYPVALKNRIFEHSYYRRSPESRKKEYIGYGGQNHSMNTGDNERWFSRVQREDSVFKDKVVLRLNTAWWMNPWAKTEGIPANA